MGTPGLGYALYLFDGKRGNRVPKNGYGICLYDSRNVPEPPIIKDPVLQIDQNSAGTVTFTLLSGAEGTIMIDGGQGISYSYNQPIMNYVCYMQSEIVVYRSKAIKNSTVPVYEEIWAGRVYSIKKDFYNNWKITAEGSLAYFNDFSMLEYSWKDQQGKAGEKIFQDILQSYNDAVDTANTDPETSGGARTIVHTIDQEHALEFAPLDRHISRGTISTHKWKAATKISNSDTTFTVSDGTTFMSAMNSLLSRFGGFFEIKYEYKNGYSNTVINWRQDDEYHSIKDGQSIVFGKNLLDYIEDLEDSEFFTALYPMGTTNVTTTDESDNKTTKKMVVKIDGLGAHTESIQNGTLFHPNRSPYIYNKELVKQYGFIEKKEKWEIGDPNELMDVAFNYYKDLSLGEPIVEINAFDLKNLITTDLKKDSYYKLDSLYLYDQIRVDGHPFLDSSKKIPITGIEIPLDKFPTDTKYTMSNKKLSKSGLAPGNIPGVKPEESLPDPDPGENEDPDPSPEEEPVKYLHPVGGDLGIDANMPHYPLVYLRRSASQWQCRRFRLKPMPGETSEISKIVFFNFNRVETWTGTDINTIPDNKRKGRFATKRVLVDQGLPTEHREDREVIIDWVAQGSTTYACVTKQYEDTFAALASQSDFKFSNSGLSVTSQAGRLKEFAFFCDNMSKATPPFMRLKDIRIGNKEKPNDYYEFANVKGDPPTWSTNPVNYYSSAFTPYFSHSDAEVSPDQSWRKHFVLSKQQITQKVTGGNCDFKYYWINETMSHNETKLSYYNRLTTILNSLPLFGNTGVNTILNGINMHLMPDENSNCFDIRLDYAINDGGTDTVSIYRHLIDYWPDSQHAGDTSRHMGLISTWTNAANDTTVIYYSYINGAADSPIPFDNLKDKTIDNCIDRNESAAQYTADLQAAIGYYETRLNELVNNTYLSPEQDAQYSADLAATYRILLNHEPEAGHQFPEGVNGINQAYAALMFGSPNCNLEAPRSKITRIYNNAVKLKLIQTMKPLLIVTKVKEIGSGGDQYGVIFSGGNYKTNPNSISVEDGKNILHDDTLLAADVNGQKNPILYCKDVLMHGDGGIFEYYEDTGRVAVKMPNITYSKSDSSRSASRSPIAVMTKCGGPHTAYISNGVYTQFCGSYNYGKPSDVWSTSWPAYNDGEPSDYPNYRSTRHEDNNYIWYNGPNMKTDPDTVEIPHMLDFYLPESQLYLEDVRYRVPLAVGEDLFIRVGSAYIKNTPIESEGE